MLIYGCLNNNLSSAYIHFFYTLSTFALLKAQIKAYSRILFLSLLLYTNDSLCHRIYDHGYN